MVDKKIAESLAWPGKEVHVPKVRYSYDGHLSARAYEGGDVKLWI